MSQIGSIGSYKVPGPVGTGHCDIQPSGDKSRSVDGTQAPTNFGFVAAAASVTAPIQSVTPVTAACVKCSLGRGRDTAQLNFLIASYSGGAYSSANNISLVVQLYLEKEIVGNKHYVEYQYKYVGTVTLTAGSNKPATASKVLNPDAYFADTIVVTEDASLLPGFVVSGQAGTPAQDIAALSLDTEGAIALLCFPKDADATKFLGVEHSEI